MVNVVNAMFDFILFLYVGYILVVLLTLPVTVLIAIVVAVIKKTTTQKSLKEIVLKHPSYKARLEAFKKITDERILEELATESTDKEIRELAIEKTNQKVLLLFDHVSTSLSPKKKVTYNRKNELPYEFANYARDGYGWKKTDVIYGEYTNEKSHIYEVTKSGWALAALGRLIARNCSPEQFEQSLEDYNRDVIPAYNKDLEELEETRLKLLDTMRLLDAMKANPEIISPLPYFSKTNTIKQFNELAGKFDDIHTKIDRGILTYADKAGVLPFSFFMHVMTDSQSRFDRFIRQGAIMGMFDFLTKYKDNEIIKPYYETLIAARANMITSDSQMSFFEVRVPRTCTAKEYAEILKEVLHCANPDIPYCDTYKLMEIAEKEIPGIMDLFVNYPLRLIDPGNDATEGFYHFQPFLHQRWVNYTPPQSVGQVQRRYLEVLDMTLPNSSGLNIRLFTDPYAAIPVMFHEYCHYMEDPNEASVFLKTHIFSLKFYRKYKEANPENDNSFIHLNLLLGKSIDSGKFNYLNKLILKYYGDVKSKAEAEKEANGVVVNMNYETLYLNEHETWCPEIKRQLLNDDEDKTNADLIRKIIIRYAQVPKSITSDKFEQIKANYFSIKRSYYKKYKSLVPKMLSQPDEKKESDGKFIMSFSNYKSFKDWSIQEGHIKQYKGG
jgi:hypothetical protein